MNANLLRRVNWLWKHRHTHDDDNFQEQITLIRETVQSQTDDVTAITDAGAYLHLLRASSQTIAVDGEALELTAYGLFERQNFGAVSFPATEFTIQEPGYYDVSVEDLEWDTFTGGGTVQIIRVRDGNEAVVREWTSTYGRVFEEGVAHAVPCEAGDKIKVFVDHDDTSSHDIAGAKLVIYLVDSVEGVSAIGVVDKITSKDTGTEHTIAMTTAQESGDLLLMLLNSTGSGTWTSYPAGWTALEDNFQYGNSGGNMSVLYKVSDGTETDVTADTGSTSFTVHAVWVIRSEQDYSTTAPDIATTLKVQARTVDPPEVTVSHGVGNYLSFVLVARNGGQRTVETLPDNYSEFLDETNGATSDDPGINVFDRRLIIATSEDPTSVTFDDWVAERVGATTVAVRI